LNLKKCRNTLAVNHIDM